MFSCLENLEDYENSLFYIVWGHNQHPKEPPQQCCKCGFSKKINAFASKWLLQNHNAICSSLIVQSTSLAYFDVTAPLVSTVSTTERGKVHRVRSFLRQFCNKIVTFLFETSRGYEIKSFQGTFQEAMLQNCGHFSRKIVAICQTTGIA